MNFIWNIIKHICEWVITTFSFKFWICNWNWYILEAHQVYSWGFGLLGFGPNIQQCIKPTKIPEVLFGLNDFQPDNIVVNIFCGVSHSAVVTSKGDLFSWGRNRNGCLGLRNDKDQNFPLKVIFNYIQ